MKHLGSSFVLSHFFSFSLCFCCDSCSDADVWTWSLIETWLSSSCPGCVTLISACPCFCCDDAYLGTVTGTRCDPWTASALYVWAAPLRFPQRVCPGRAARPFFCVVSMPSRGPSFEPVLRRSGLFQENSATKKVSTRAKGRWYQQSRQAGNSFPFNIHSKQIMHRALKSHQHVLN